MKNKRLFLILVVCNLLATIVVGQELPAQGGIFEQYMKQAQTFASNYPREKAYLHFDNTSYYIGDTIWFKAYVTLAEQPTFSEISRPLYVELIDQAGHIRDKQIIKLSQGQGNGQIALPKSLLSGYYEVRAYTRWMLGFSEPQYFSRTFPIYQLARGNQSERNITNYDLSTSMDQRPEITKKKLDIGFFPEGGQLVEGIESRVAFKAESNRDGDIQLSGALYSADGKELAKLETMHDGMGHFNYTPTSSPAVAKVNFKGNEYKFELPKALPSGYVMKVDNASGVLSVNVSCNAKTVQDSLAIFISHAGRPYAYKTIYCQADAPQYMTMRSRDLPSGVIQISLINRAGHTVCERFTFCFPKAPLRISASGLKRVYEPYAPIRCELQLKDSSGNPVAGNLSVSVRDALRSDYLEYDNNLFTDLLFTSDLKGYIHQPGYYLVDMDIKKLQELDILMLVHGWRKYDMEQIIGVTPYTPLQRPESQLVLNGQVKSTILKNELKNIGLSVMIKKEEGIITGQTVTDENGRFSIPMEDFEGSEEALFQTRRLNKNRNKDAFIMIDRNFSPKVRPLDYLESHPEWKDLDQWRQVVDDFDSLYLDSLRRVESDFLLDEVVVKSKKRKGYMDTKISEKSIDAYYDVRQIVDLLRDQGKFVNSIPEFLEIQSPQFLWDKRDDSYTYRLKPMKFIFDGKILSRVEEKMMLTEIDGLASMIICKGSQAIRDEILNNSSLSGVNDVLDLSTSDDRSMTDDMNRTDPDDLSSTNNSSTSSTSNSNTLNTNKKLDMTNLDEFIFVYLIPLPHHDIMNKNETAAWGTRKTVIQGYTPVLECYSPSYPQKQLYMDRVDRRRTLYWNPTVQTDAEGKAVIECYNNQYSTPLVIQAETMTNGRIGSVTYSTIPVADK